MTTFLGWNGLRWLDVLAGVMALLVMVDAFIGHYRSGFAVKAQYAPLVVGTAILVAAVLTAIAGCCTTCCTTRPSSRRSRCLPWARWR